MKLESVKILDMKDGTINKVEYEGTVYVKDDDYAVKGDLIFIQHETDKGFYKVENNKNTAWVCFTDSFKRKMCCTHTDCTVFRKKQERLKVGDYAKVIGHFSNSSEGDIVKILEDEPWADFPPFKCEFISKEDKKAILFYEDELVLATEDEIRVAKEVETKRTAKLKWSKIGRKVDEFREGDIVKIQGTEKLCEVIVVDYCTLYVRRNSESAGFEFKKKATLVCPVEARFDQN
ncbi:hypothetical protein HKK70_08795 [Bacillus safensis]|uniref:hypothetical protein n=1 Tax=Bacillus safensis TaxID=561879 RepID=UPI00146CC713|nr:hypothetical protein [Bacillus safensis]MCM3366006.1 hypothetical protein [Bacillus safensis]NMW01862.1 hypothetical protein [Bacillus safensis]